MVAGEGMRVCDVLGCGQYADRTGRCPAHRPVTDGRLVAEMKRLKLGPMKPGESGRDFMRRHGVNPDLSALFKPMPAPSEDNPRVPGEDDDLVGGCTCKAQGTCPVCQQWAGVL